MPYLFVPGFNVVRKLQHAFILSWYLLIKVCQEPNLKVWLLSLSHKYGLYLLIPWTILWEKQQLWTLSQKHEETLYLLPLMTAVSRWSGDVLLWSCPKLPHLWIWGLTAELMQGGAGVKKEKLSYKLEAKCPYISWITTSFFYYQVNTSLQTVDAKFFFSATHNWTCTWIRKEKPSLNILNSFY